MASPGARAEAVRPYFLPGRKENVCPPPRLRHRNKPEGAPDPPAVCASLGVCEMPVGVPSQSLRATAQPAEPCVVGI